jgi:hypothetical protein
MRPSGRKAIRQGNSKVVTVVMVKGSVASGFCAPILTCPATVIAVATAASMITNTVVANFIVYPP